MTLQQGPAAGAAGGPAPRDEPAMDPEKRLRLEQRKLDEMRQRITQESYLQVMDVARHFNVSRATVESWPFEILPYRNGKPGAKKQLRRYHPADVAAAGARLRGWERAIDEGRGAAFLDALRAQVEERDEAAMRIADEMARQTWAGAA